MCFYAVTKQKRKPVVISLTKASTSCEIVNETGSTVQNLILSLQKYKSIIYQYAFLLNFFTIIVFCLFVL